MRETCVGEVMMNFAQNYRVHLDIDFEIHKPHWTFYMSTGGLSNKKIVSRAILDSAVSLDFFRHLFMDMYCEMSVIKED